MGLVRLFFSYNGRINRKQYWLGNVGLYFATWILLFVASLPLGASFAMAKENPVVALQSFASFGFFFSAVMLANSWCGFALQVKRFHDRGQTGWLALLPFIPVFALVSTIIEAAMQSWSGPQLYEALKMPVLALFVLSLAFFINLGCLAGTNGPNKHGDPPGSSGGGRPTLSPTPPVPGARSAGNAAAAANAMFGSAQAAMDRAIAENARNAAAPAAARPASARLSPAPAGGGGSFGRRVR